jgi:hypothetical protein
VAFRSRYGAERWEKAMSYKTQMHGHGESHSGVLPTKRSNAGQGGPKEIAEGRPLTKENAEGEPRAGHRAGSAGNMGRSAYAKQTLASRSTIQGKNRVR